MRKQVVKVNMEQLETLLDEFRLPMLSFDFNGNWEEKFSGKKKVALSVKVGKKRKIITGRIRWIDYESSNVSGGYVIFRFFPNNQERLNEILNKKGE